MTEAEAIESLTNIGEVTATFGGLWLSSTFAFLTVCYLVGKALTLFECLLISVLYGTSAFMFASATLGYIESWFKLKAQETTVMDGIWLFNGMESYWYGTAAVFYGGTFVSLYFMYNIRHRKDDQTST